MTFLALAVLLAAAPTPAPAGADPAADEWHRLVGVLSYLEADYPAAVASQDAFELAEQSSFIDEAVATARRLGPEGAPFVARLEALATRIHRGQDPEGVRRECATLARDLVAAGGLQQSPRRTPDLARGRDLFAAQCAACHGADGRAQTEVAKTLQPPPADFHDPERMAVLTPYQAYNTITFGVTGTGMASFATLSEQDRWALAFYLFTLRHPGCDHRPPELTLQALSTTSDAQLAAAYGAAEVACLRQALPLRDDERLWADTRAGIQKGLALFAAGDAQGGRAAVLDAYLDGFEPLEPRLRATAPDAVQRLEQGFADLRVAMERDGAKVPAAGAALLAQLDGAGSAPSGGGPASVFWMTVVILLREGFEAFVVIAALLALLRKMEQPGHARLVHAGWVSAALLGAGAFFFARHLIDGARREWVEGVVALVAVAMLLYAAFWLNARANVRKMMGELRARMSAALGRNDRWGLFLIAFTAMLRESFETALFLQGLATDSGVGVFWGVLTGVALLGGFVLMVRRVGYVLPMKTLFTASTVLMLVTAVVLLGKGIHALQEVGALPLRPLGRFSVDLLGLYADAWSLLPQLLLAAVPLVVWWVRRGGTTSTQPVTESR